MRGNLGLGAVKWGFVRGNLGLGAVKLSFEGIKRRFRGIKPCFEGVKRRWGEPKWPPAGTKRLPSFVRGNLGLGKAKRGCEDVKLCF